MCRALIFTVLFACGCTAEVGMQAGNGSDVVFISPGVSGNSGYIGVVHAVTKPGVVARVIPWGSPILFANFSDKSVHDDAEMHLVAEIEAWRLAHPNGRIDLIGHSAGGGVVLGAIKRLKSVHVHNVILLAPSVSPEYDLRPIFWHMYGKLHVFYSERDTMLAWRTSTFECYDRVKGPAAGVGGFRGKYATGRFVQHPYDPNWINLGYDGGHWGPLAEPFEQQVVAPLLLAN